jgi:hypothetical protein
MIVLDGKEPAWFQDAMEAWIDALELHALRSHDYRDRSTFNLGVKGEFVGIMRKVQKLKQDVWDNKTLDREGVQEVLMDLMGSVGLMLMEWKRERGDVYGASWRDNSRSKPTFGPKSGL